MLKRLRKPLGVAVALTALWVLDTILGWSPLGWTAPSVAAPPAANGSGSAAKANPCNPCNPDRAGATGQTNPCNPCNPNRAATATANPCNPCNPNGAGAGAANPCNPCNPCNPNGGTAADATSPCNPCNPCSPGGSVAAVSFGSGNGEKLDWTEGYRGWEQVTGYVFSASHGNRLMVTYVTPFEAAEIFKRNAERARLHLFDEMEHYPQGTRIAAASWLPDDKGAPGRPGPLFFLRKEPAGYDPSGDNWRYVFARQDRSLLGEGHDGRLQFCKTCHSRVADRDFVYATRR